MGSRPTVKAIVKGKPVEVPTLLSAIAKKKNRDPFIATNYRSDVLLVQELFNVLIRHAHGSLAPYFSELPENGTNDEGYIHLLIETLQNREGIQGKERELNMMLPQGETMKALAAKALDILCNTKTVPVLQTLSTFPQIRAMLETIAWAEGLNDDYRRIVIGIVKQTPNGKYKEFIGKSSREIVISLDEHPQIYVDWKKGEKLSSAAGRFQLVYSTWEEVQKIYHFPDFSPRSQELGAIARMVRREMIRPLLTRNYEGAFRNGNREWASFPGSPYGQHHKSMTEIVEVYKKHLASFRNK
ncbi:MAG: glycoside hydrolase family 104 protein [Acidobacteria bacterium]|nr:glycoside hydrolase family 104 protein [Acidobacteriota bacterium]